MSIISSCSSSSKGIGCKTVSMPHAQRATSGPSAFYTPDIHLGNQHLPLSSDKMQTLLHAALGPRTSPSPTNAPSHRYRQGAADLFREIHRSCKGTVSHKFALQYTHAYAHTHATQTHTFIRNTHPLQSKSSNFCGIASLPSSGASHIQILRASSFHQSKQTNFTASASPRTLHIPPVLSKPPSSPLPVLDQLQSSSPRAKAGLDRSRPASFGQDSLRKELAKLQCPLSAMASLKTSTSPPTSQSLFQLLQSHGSTSQLAADEQQQKQLQQQQCTSASLDSGIVVRSRTSLPSSATKPAHLPSRPACSASNIQEGGRSSFMMVIGEEVVDL